MPMTSAYAPSSPEPQRLTLFGVDITDADMAEALGFLEDLLRDRSRAHTVYFVNAHTLNLVHEDPDYRRVLQRADFVFGDGTGVRWAVRALHDRRLKDNVNGTDLVPAMFRKLAGRGFRYYLLGATPDAIERAAAHARTAFPGWDLVGYHHGYLDDVDPSGLIDRINASGADLLLVGMGNPKQERWIDAHQVRLKVPVCMGVGGLFTYWSGDLDRAPAWVRQLGYEWLHLLLKQPHKARRYVLGNPQFLWRIAHEWLETGGWRAR